MRKKLYVDNYALADLIKIKCDPKPAHTNRHYLCIVWRDEEEKQFQRRKGKMRKACIFIQNQFIYVSVIHNTYNRK